MAVLDPIHPVQSSVIETLILRRSLTVAEIHEILINEYSLSVSSTNLYRVIAQLVEKQVLTRISGRITLNLVWVTHVMKFAEILEEQFMGKNSSVVDLPQEEGEKIVFSEDSLLALDPIWNDLLMTLARKRVDNIFWGFNSHAWYSIGAKHTEQKLYQGLKELGVHSRMLIGNNSFLDEFGLRMMDRDTIDVSTRTCSSLPMPLQSENLVIWVAGPFIAESRLPQAVSTLFEFFFKTVMSPDEFDIQAFFDLFRVRAKCSITVTKSANEATRMRELFQEAYAIDTPASAGLVYT